MGEADDDDCIRVCAPRDLGGGGGGIRTQFNLLDKTIFYLRCCVGEMSRERGGHEQIYTDVVCHKEILHSISCARSCIVQFRWDSSLALAVCVCACVRACLLCCRKIEWSYCSVV